MVDEDGDKARRLQRDHLRKIGANPDAMSDEEYRAATARQFVGTPDDVAADSSGGCSTRASRGSS